MTPNKQPKEPKGDTQEERVRDITVKLVESLWQGHIVYIGHKKPELYNEIEQVLTSYGIERFADGKKVGWNEALEKAAIVAADYIEECEGTDYQVDKIILRLKEKAR